MKPVDNAQLESLLVYSFSYALGRMTYSVYDVADAIIKNKHALHPHTKELIEEEIKKAVGHREAEMEMDVEIWSGVYAELTDEQTI
jgi:hypothetical protein